MCLQKQLPVVQPKVKTPSRSPRRRHIRELSKPRLSRRIVPSSRICLNNYWSKFEETLASGSSIVDFDLPLKSTTSQNQFDGSLENVINENLVNELLEMGKI